MAEGIKGNGKWRTIWALPKERQAVLSAEALKETDDMLILSYVPQIAVLEHPTVKVAISSPLHTQLAVSHPSLPLCLKKGILYPWRYQQFI